MEENPQELYPYLISGKIEESRLFLAAKYGFTQLVRYFISQGDIRDSKNEALQAGAQFGHLETVKLLVQAGADIHTSDEEPLNLAITGGHLEIVKYLIQQGADLTYNNFPGCAVIGEQIEVFKYLIRLDPDMIDYPDELLLLCIEFCSGTRMLRFLLNFYSWNQYRLNVALEQAVSYGKLDMVQEIVQLGGQIISDLTEETSDPEMIKYLNDHM